MINIEVNGKKIEAQDNEMLLSALKRKGINVPTLCNMSDLLPTGSCRMCVVEIEGRENLVPSCAFPVYDGMKVSTHSIRAVEARRTIIELLLANHPDDCLYCVRNGDCELRKLSDELGIRSRRYSGTRKNYKLDLSSPAIVRDPAKCILCGKCVRVCEEVQGVSAIDFVNRGSETIVGTTFDQGINVSSCVFCGQCVAVCPTGALAEKSQIKEVITALDDPQKLVVVQHAPSISVTLGEEFGIKPGTDIRGVMTATLRQLGFDKVFDTAFSADLTIMEEAAELVQRIRTGGKLPMMTSCSPGWIKFVEEFYPEMTDNLSTAKSPQQMLGAIIKSYYADQIGVNPKDIYSVAVMPCTAKKFEAGRPEMAQDGIADVDAVLTTRELAQLIRMRGVDLNSVEPELDDNPFGVRTTAGKLFGASGGVMEAALRTAYHLIEGKELEELKISSLRGFKGIKEAHITIGDKEVGVAAVSGLMNAKKLLDEIQSGRSDLHFIEVMTCPGGCIAGGGQPRASDTERLKARMKALYKIDRDEEVRTSHSNESVKRLYDEFLENPLSKKSHEILHTHYNKRDVYR